MGLRDRLKKLQQRATDSSMIVLQCPGCSGEFVAYGDVALEYIVYEWSREAGEEGHHETPEDMLLAFEHEHDSSTLVEKTSGLPFLDKRVSGIDFSSEAEVARGA